jgi:hypothetical protein
VQSLPSKLSTHLLLPRWSSALWVETLNPRTYTNIYSPQINEQLTALNTGNSSAFAQMIIRGYNTNKDGIW